jgi:hypothetical protein
LLTSEGWQRCVHLRPRAGLAAPGSNPESAVVGADSPHLLELQRRAAGPPEAVPGAAVDLGDVADSRGDQRVSLAPPRLAPLAASVGGGAAAPSGTRRVTTAVSGSTRISSPCWSNAHTAPAANPTVVVGRADGERL